MIRPCSIQLCDCPGADSPVLNVSSESPDPLLFAGVGWDPYNPFAIPPLGNGTLYVSTDCFNISYSAISQALADLMAQNNAALCANPPGPWPFPPFPPWPDLPPFPDFNWTPTVFVPPNPNYQQFTNERQEATASCPNGAIFTYAVEAGTLLSPRIDPLLGPVMVQLLNAQAMAFALQQVSAMRVCIDVTGMDIRFPPTIPPTPPTPPTPPNHPSGRGPTLAANPGWCCFGEDLIPVQNTYSLGRGSAAFTFSVVGGLLAPGTSLDQISPRVAEVAGTPSTPGVYTYTIMAVQNGNPSISVKVTDTLRVFGMTTQTLPDGTVGTLYSEQLLTAGGTNLITFSLVGSLPDGLSLGTTGSISGTPTTAGTSAFTVKFTDAQGATCEEDVAITINAPVGLCTDWNAMVWSPPSSHNCVFTPSPSGNFVSILFSDNSGLAGAGFQSATAIQVGGPCNCNIHAFVAAQSPGAHFNIRVSNGGVYLNWDFTIDWVGGIPGSNDIAFTLPAPGLYNIDISVFGYDGESSQFTLIFTNVP